jgi:hypothetical protein
LLKYVPELLLKIKKIVFVHIFIEPGVDKWGASDPICQHEPIIPIRSVDCGLRPILDFGLTIKWDERKMQLRLPTYDDVVGSLHGFLMYM